MIARGLIGHTGFVGGTLARARSFDAQYNSSNFRDMAGQEFGLLVCAGVSAAKWIANADPQADAERIDALRAVLDTVTVREFVLISTIDVYADSASGADETAEPDGAAHHAYGRHRRALEVWARDRFPRCRIVRLPALFGAGLRKNALYDLLHDNQVDRINPATRFQWYPMARLADDIDRARAADLLLVNLFPEPVDTREILDAFFPGARTASPTAPAPEYRLTTRHAAVFGGHDGYVLDALGCLGEMARFVAAERAGMA